MNESKSSKISINFNKLEADLFTAQHKEDKYQRENDAKFRAIAQKVPTYEDFRYIINYKFYIHLINDL